MHADAGIHGNAGLARHMFHQPRGGGFQARFAISVQLHECEIPVDAQASRAWLEFGRHGHQVMGKQRQRGHQENRSFRHHYQTTLFCGTVYSWAL